MGLCELASNRESEKLQTVAQKRIRQEEIALRYLPLLTEEGRWKRLIKMREKGSQERNKQRYRD